MEQKNKGERMKFEKTISFSVTLEEYREIARIVAERNLKGEETVNKSQLIREWVLPNLNGSKNVSQAAIDTDSKQKNNPDNSKPPENVSDPPDDTSKSPWKVFNMDDMYDDQ
jgi:cell division septal protein FtsQ